MDVGATTQDEQPDGEANALVGRTLGGRFKVLRTIGRGGMGAVYEVDRDGARAALKIIARGGKGADARALKRFEREAALASEIDHPNVTRTLEHGLDDELEAPFLLMELLTGKDLGAVIDESAPLAPEVVARLGVQAARGLAAAHARGIIHRDVKPQNLFLDRADDLVTVKVCDFGIAKLGDRARDDEASSLTNSGGIIGSPRYMSPEQAQGAKDLDARTDIWSLCASLYEALAGRRLWSAETLGELIVTICTKSVPPLTHAAPWVPGELASVVHKGLARDPEGRWASMAELEAALLPFTADTTTVRASEVVPVPAKGRTSNTQRAVTSTRADTTHAPAAVSVDRTKSPWFGLATAAAVIIGGGSLWSALRAQQPGVGSPSTTVALSSPPTTAAEDLDPNGSAPAEEPASPTDTARVPPALPSASALEGSAVPITAPPRAPSALDSRPASPAEPLTTASDAPTPRAGAPVGSAKVATPTASGALPTTEEWR